MKKTPMKRTARELCEFLERENPHSIIDLSLYLKAKNQGWVPLRDGTGKELIGVAREIPHGR